MIISIDAVQTVTLANAAPVASGHQDRISAPVNQTWTAQTLADPGKSETVSSGKTHLK
jgi:hypothetical protein